MCRITESVNRFIAQGYSRELAETIVAAIVASTQAGFRAAVWAEALKKAGMEPVQAEGLAQAIEEYSPASRIMAMVKAAA